MSDFAESELFAVLWHVVNFVLLSDERLCRTIITDQMGMECFDLFEIGEECIPFCIRNNGLMIDIVATIMIDDLTDELVVDMANMFECRWVGMGGDKREERHEFLAI